MRFPKPQPGMSAPALAGGSLLEFPILRTCFRLRCFVGVQPAGVVGMHVAGSSIHPGCEGPVLAEGVPVFQNAAEYLLGQFLAQRLVPGQAQEVVVRTDMVSLEKDRQPLDAAGAKVALFWQERRRSFPMARSSRQSSEQPGTT